MPTITRRATLARRVAAPASLHRVALARADQPPIIYGSHVVAVLPETGA